MEIFVLVPLILIVTFVMGFLGALKFMRGQYETLPGLKDFYMIGSTVGGSGLPGCAAQGRNLIREICHKQKTPFTPKTD